MKSIAKFLIPVTLAASAFTVNARVLEIDYSQPEISAQAARSGVVSTAEPLLIQTSQGAAMVNPAAVKNDTSRSRVDVRRESAEPRKFDIGYFA